MAAGRKSAALWSVTAKCGAVDHNLAAEWIRLWAPQTPPPAPSLGLEQRYRVGLASKSCEIDRTMSISLRSSLGTAACSSSSTMSSKPWAAAQCSGVQPLESGRPKSAPRARSASTVRRRRCRTAQQKGGLLVAALGVERAVRRGQHESGGIRPRCTMRPPRADLSAPSLSHCAREPSPLADGSLLGLQQTPISDGLEFMWCGGERG